MALLRSFLTAAPDGDIADGVVRALRGVVNPDKLQHLGAMSDLPRLPDRTRTERA